MAISRYRWVTPTRRYGFRLSTTLRLLPMLVVLVPGPLTAPNHQPYAAGHSSVVANGYIYTYGRWYYQRQLPELPFYYAPPPESKLVVTWIWSACRAKTYLTRVMVALAPVGGSIITGNNTAVGSHLQGQGQSNFFPGLPANGNLSVAAAPDSSNSRQFNQRPSNPKCRQFKLGEC